MYQLLKAFPFTLFPKCNCKTLILISLLSLHLFLSILVQVEKNKLLVKAEVFDLILYSFSSSVIIFVHVHRVQNNFKQIFIMQFAWLHNDLENKESGLWCSWDSSAKYKVFWKTDHRTTGGLFSFLNIVLHVLSQNF